MPSKLKKVFSDSAFTAATSVASLIKSIIVIKIITNLAGTSEYGIWVTVNAIVSLVVSTGGMHLHGSLVRFESQKSNNRAYSDILFLTICIGFIISTISIGIFQYIDVLGFFNSLERPTMDLILASNLLFIGTLILSINLNYYRAKGNVKFYEIFRLVKHILEILILVSVFLVYNSIIVGLLSLGTLYTSINLIFIGNIVLTKEVPWPNPQNFIEYITYGVPMVPSELSKKILEGTDKFLLLFFIGPAAVGIYTVGKNASRPLTQLTGVFNGTLYPTITKSWDNENIADIEEIYLKIFRFYFIIGIPASFGITLLADSLIKIISTSTISVQSTYLIPVFVTGFLLRGLANSLEYIYMSAKDTKSIALITTAAGVINAVLNIMFIPSYGMLGAAVATLVAQTVMFIFYFIKKPSQINITIPWKTISNCLFSAIVMSLSLTLIGGSLNGWKELIVYPSVGFVTYTITIYSIGELSKEEIELLKSTLI